MEPFSGESEVELGAGRAVVAGGQLAHRGVPDGAVPLRQVAAAAARRARPDAAALPPDPLRVPGRSHGESEALKLRL